MNHSNRMQKVSTAIIPEINRMVGQHKGTISLGQGVVFYPPPPQALEYACQQINSPTMSHIYGEVAGLDALRHAIAGKLQTNNNIADHPDTMVFVTAGANMAFNALILAICDSGDEVILLSPYYFNHEMTIAMCDCKPVCVATDENYQPIIENIKAAITDKTKAIVSVSPNNPTGAVYSEPALTAINALCAEHNIYHISDEAYEDFVFEEYDHFSPASLNNAGNHTLSLFSMSKSYGLAGWRVGYMLIPKTLHSALTKVQDNILICPPIISQYAGIACLKHGAEYVGQQLKVIDDNRKLCLQQLKPLIDKGLISTPPAQGAMYLFIRINTQTDDQLIAQKLIEQYQVAVIPGSAFGTDGTLRISYGALDTQQIKEGISRLVKGLSELLT